MPTTTITTENIQATLEQNGIVLLDWWASWCGPCRAFAPVFEAASAKHDDIVFGKVDTEDQQDLSALFGIRAIPTLMVFREGVLLFSEAGAIPAAALEDLIRQVRTVDMAEVHKQIAEQEEEADEEDDTAN